MGLKVAMVTPWNVKCGIFTYTKDLALALGQEDVEVFVVRLPRFGIKTPSILIDVAERIPYDKVDLVHVQHEYGLYQSLEAPFFTAVRTHGKPIVTTMHAVGNYEMDVVIAGCSNKTIVHNKSCANRFQFPNSTIIPHGVTPSEPMENELAKSQMQIPKGVKIVGYLGFISNYKGLETLVTAMTKVPNAALMICGGWHLDVQNDYIDRLRKWSEDLLPHRVAWKGFIPDDKLPVAYGAMDVMVYPSRFSTESGALLHGIAFGRAILASNLEGFREKEEEGALMTFKNADDLADKIIMLLGAEGWRNRLEAGARGYAEKYSWTNVAKQHVSLYESVLKGSAEH